jgi:hypothetical protein
VTQHTGRHRFLKVFDRLLLAGEATALLMMQPTELLQNLGVVGVTFKHARVSSFGRVVLWVRVLAAEK